MRPRLVQSYGQFPRFYGAVACCDRIETRVDVGHGIDIGFSYAGLYSCYRSLVGAARVLVQITGYLFVTAQLACGVKDVDVHVVEAALFSLRGTRIDRNGLG